MLYAGFLFLYDKASHIIILIKSWQNPNCIRLCYAEPLCSEIVTINGCIHARQKKPTAASVDG